LANMRACIHCREVRIGIGGIVAEIRDIGIGHVGSYSFQYN